MSAAVLVAVLGSTPAAGSTQNGAWAISADVSTVWFGGGAEDPAADITIGPGPATAFGLGVTRVAGSVRLGVRLLRLESGLRLSGEGVTLTAENSGFTLYELAPEVSFRLVQLGSAGSNLRLAGGPTFDLWQLAGVDDRTRAGGRALVALEIPVAGGWIGATWLEGAVSGSVFDANELPSEYERRSLLRGSVGVELRYGW